MELNLYVSAKGAPGAHRIPKGYTDLLWKEPPSGQIKRPHLLIKDDSLVKYLAVNYHIVDSDPMLHIQIDRFQHMLEDIKMLTNFEDLLGDNHDPATSGAPHEPTDLSSIGTLFGPAALASMKFLRRLDHQADILESSDFKFSRLRALLSGFWGDPRMAKINLIRRDQVLSLPPCINLGPPQLRRGESLTFKHTVAEKIQVHSGRLNLKPLLHSLKCTIIIIPPDSDKHKGSLRDIDNMAFHYIVPIINSLLEPEATLGNIFARHFEYAWTFEKGLRLDASLPHTLVGYEILELNRFQADPTDGCVYLFLGKTDFSRGLWQELDERLNDLVQLHQR